MVTLAITGGIASGKSLALKYFEHFGAYGIDCDAIVDSLYKKAEIRRKLVMAFGTADKKKIAKFVFNDNAVRKRLESIIIPYVIKELEEEIERGKKECKVVAVEVPLLFELSLEKLFDKTIVVEASTELQVKRLMEKGFTREEALSRIKAQMPVEEKIKKADFVIDNESSYKELIERVRRIFNEVAR